MAHLSFCVGISSCPAPFVGKTCSFLQWMVLIHVENQLTINGWVCVWIFNYVPLIFMLVLITVVYNKFWYQKCESILFFISFIWAISNPLHFHINFRVSLSNLRNPAVLRLLSIPIHEHRMFLCLFSSSIFFNVLSGLVHKSLISLNKFILNTSVSWCYCKWIVSFLFLINF
jgi:hypothetical protein